MATTNFVQFNTSKNNMQNDHQYQSNNTRINGLTTGLADSKLHNKLFYQLSTLSTAIASFINNKGYDANDDNISTLTTNLTNALKGNVYESMTATSSGGGYHINELGISGLKTGNNWYVNLGKTYGNMIIQTGVLPTAGLITTIVFPIGFTANYKLFALHSGTNGLNMCELYTSHNLLQTQIRTLSLSDGSTSTGWIIYWLAIGY